MPILTRSAHPAVALLALLTVPLLLLLAGCSTTREADRYTRQAQAAAAQHAHQPSVYLQNDWPTADDL
jgi:uncharacterized lipoprotein